MKARKYLFTEEHRSNIEYGKIITIDCEVLCVEFHKLKSNPITIITVVDSEGDYGEVVVSPSLYEEVSMLIIRDAQITVIGELRPEHQIVASSISNQTPFVRKLFKTLFRTIDGFFQSNQKPTN